MKSLILLSVLAAIALSIFTPVSYADTLIYDNSNLSMSGFNGFDGSSLQEFIDYGTSTGGMLSKFIFDYSTESTSVGTIWIRFYRYTDYSDPGFLIKTFALTNVPSTGGYLETYEYTIPEQDRFELPSGDFGYSYEMSRSTTYIAMASGGQGNEDWFWIYDEWLAESLSLLADMAPEGGDGKVNLTDWAHLANAWMSSTGQAGWDADCDIAPETPDGQINELDLTEFADQWLYRSARFADIAPASDPDGRVDLLDYALFSENWLLGTD